MRGSTHTQPRRVKSVLDLRGFDQFVEQELAKHIPRYYEETKHRNFLSGLYQCLASEISYYKGKCYCSHNYETRSFRRAYHLEDQMEILDELVCELRERVCVVLGVKTLKYGVRVEFITHNQWLINYIEEERCTPKDCT